MSFTTRVRVGEVKHLNSIFTCILFLEVFL
jgi:hypothetical protein